ncbi:tripartite tricarboxylate transporter substrate binding protein [Ferrovibrio sp.]|uniref:tripartite tricarboxylate transporter substrate binding protein n=1 Tax=Ferrovibrio sp. TaxID=1917215 RepID=UPI0035AE0B02
MKRFAIAFAIAALLPAGLLPAAGHAQAGYPSKQITIVVPFGAGGGTDVLTRIVGARISEQVGQPVIVENKPGASGIIGTNQVAKAPADGYTVLMVPSLLAIGQAIRPKPPYDLQKDFASVSIIGETPFVLISSPDFAAKSLPDLVRMAKAQPGKFSYASTGQGSTAHLAVELLKNTAGIDLLHVPMSREPEAVTEVMTGRIDVMFASLQAASAHVKAGKLRGLAVGSQKRVSVLPDVPSTAEAGYAAVQAVSWYGLMVPAGTPADAVSKLHGEVAKAIAAPDVAKRFLDMGTEPSALTPKEMDAVIAAELVRWKNTADAIGLKVE